MAVAVAPQQRMRRRTPLDAARVYQAYQHEARLQQRGAYRRVAEAYGYSSDSIERKVKEYEAGLVAKAETPVALTYTPPDMAYERTRATLNAAFAEQVRRDDAAALPQVADECRASLMSREPEIERETRQTATETPITDDAVCRSVERENNQQAPARMPHTMPQHAPYRVVLRVPVETPRAGLVAWLQVHDAVRLQLLAFVIVAMLIAVCSL